MDDTKVRDWYMGDRIAGYGHETGTGIIIVIMIFDIICDAIDDGCNRQWVMQ